MIPQKATWATGQNIESISTPAPLPYSLITVKVIELEKVTISDMKSLKTFS